MSLRVEGFAIVSEDGMVADAAGVMPPALLVDADQAFLSAALDRAGLLVHGRHSHENQPQSPSRRRLIVTRQVAGTAPDREHPHALLWNPAGASLEDAAAALGVADGMVAILGGPQVYAHFLPRYDVFNLSRIAGVRILGGRDVFADAATRPEAALRKSGLTAGAQRPLDAARGVTLTVWRRA